tara:strand:+ start:1555 stop:1962 length:408 start_codon:yes stop_codon:yes gene_type:complete
MNNKLELKHLAPYLPYKVKVSKIHCIHSGEGIGSINHILTTKSDNYKPILRPLSDLTKEIEVDGNKFIPYEDDYLSDAICSYENLDLLCEYNGDISNDSTIPYPIMSLLFQWHFDVFGLIEKGLAIDINTIKDAQ